MSDGHSDIIIVNRIELSSSSLLNNTTSTCFRINCPLVCRIEYKVQFFPMLRKYWSTTTTLWPAVATTTVTTTFIYTRAQSYHSYVHSSRGAIINLMRALANQQRLALRIGSTLIELWHTRHTYIYLSMYVCLRIRRHVWVLGVGYLASANFGGVWNLCNAKPAPTLVM